MEGAPADIDALREALSAAEAEIEAVRTKLHNAVRKGKTIDAERKKAVSEVDDLAKQLAEARGQLEDVQRDSQSITSTLQEQNGELSRELKAACARAAALDEKLKQMQAESIDQAHTIKMKYQAAEEALRQQIADLQAAASQQVSSAAQEPSEALQKATARAQEAESQVADLRQEAEVMNEALQVSDFLPPIAHIQNISVTSGSADNLCLKG
jgi:chromosome segregation ATPase